MLGVNGWMQQQGALLQKTFELCFQGQETEKNKEQKTRSGTNAAVSDVWTAL